MPHLTLHYSANIEPPPDFGRLFGELHQTLAALVGIDLGNFKSRATRCDNFFVGDGSLANAFAHLDLRILRGRPADERQKLADAAVAILQTHFGQAARAADLQITVDLLDLDPDTYRKLVMKGGMP